jgi:hypothetical protein
MEKITVRFVKERETKNTVRFAEQHDDTEDPVVGTLYVKKSAVARLGNPESLTVEISR